ncbi:ABC transporter ATP-binding protein [Jeotgalibaca caeni]|uniref:ABC transporter ATP-binding protein n=1 Tax=Jeotgalibaca caeni TaxID=3028623 RepID=UPI00237D9A52|nr:ABC transporter ATP-binding protein [Jeotgalibaca caeni]MDE1549150.1 ABC transporter ATP-binding protein [Jeotgalibaca caeni]
MTLRVKDLTVRYGERTILDQISFEIPNGSIVGLVAPNGTGKTTLFNAIMRYIPIQGGEISIDDTIFQNTRPDILKLHQQITFFPDQADLYENFSGREHIQLYAETWKKDASQVDAIIELLHMEHYAHNPVRTYSLGMRQRLCFAMMCAADTPVMLMDEVMNGLDPENVNLVSGVLQKLRSEGKVIMVSSHLLDNLDEYADQVYFLLGGKIIYISDHHEKKDDYVKARLTADQFNQVKSQYALPSGTLYLDNGLCCIPIHQEDQAIHYLSTLRKFAPQTVSVGPLGTADHYIRIYDFTTENKE